LEAWPPLAEIFLPMTASWTMVLSFRDNWGLLALVSTSALAWISLSVLVAALFSGCSMPSPLVRQSGDLSTLADVPSASMLDSVGQANLNFLN